MNHLSSPKNRTLKAKIKSRKMWLIQKNQFSYQTIYSLTCGPFPSLRMSWKSNQTKSSGVLCQQEGHRHRDTLIQLLETTEEWRELLLYLPNLLGKPNQGKKKNCSRWQKSGSINTLCSPLPDPASTPDPQPPVLTSQIWSGRTLCSQRALTKFNLVGKLLTNFPGACLSPA